MQLVFDGHLKTACATVWHADYMELLSSLDDNSVDLFLTSPPYFIGKEYDISNSVSDFIHVINCILPELIRVVKPGGSVCWQVGNHVRKNRLIPLDIPIIVSMNQSDQFILRNRIIWTFSHGIHAMRRFSGRHETVLWYTNGNDYFFNLDSVRIPQKYPGKTHYRGPKKGIVSGNPLGKNPGDFWEFGAIWDIPNVKANHVEKTAHPCQFPVALARRLIRALCPVGGLVADPFCGSGTTAAAAQLEGRNVVAGDISKDYCTIAASRLTALEQGLLRYREDIPVYIPTGKEKVATMPAQFTSIRRKQP